MSHYLNFNLETPLYTTSAPGRPLSAPHAAPLGGTDKDDRLVGDHTDNTLAGLDGDDIVLGRKGNDVLYGEAVEGFDAPSPHDGADRLRGGAGNDHLFGGNGRDRLNGGGGDDVLYGGGSKDRLFGGDGDDVLVGGKGKDKLFGGEGADVFSFFRDQKETIMDFEDDVDTIAILSIGSGGSRAEVRAFLNEYAYLDGDDIVIDHLSTIRIKNFTDIKALINDIDCCSLA